MQWKEGAGREAEAGRSRPAGGGGGGGGDGGGGEAGTRAEGLLWRQRWTATSAVSLETPLVSAEEEGHSDPRQRPVAPAKGNKP